MSVTIEKITDVGLLRWACSMTTGGKHSDASLYEMYNCEHSVIRTQLFKITMMNIPTFVSVHLVRHNVGVTHFVKTNRDDRGGSDKVDRLTPVTHGMIINAQSLINMARKRLCLKSHPSTVFAMKQIRQAMQDVDRTLVLFMVPECVYRGGVCHELKTCGAREEMLDTYGFLG